MDNMSFSRGFVRDNTYYLNVLYNTNKEYNFNFVNTVRDTTLNIDISNLKGGHTILFLKYGIY